MSYDPRPGDAVVLRNGRTALCVSTSARGPRCWWLTRGGKRTPPATIRLDRIARRADDDERRAFFAQCRERA